MSPLSNLYANKTANQSDCVRKRGRRRGASDRIGRVFGVILLIGFVSVQLIKGANSAKEPRRRWSNACQSQSECPPHAICDYPSPSMAHGICVCRSGYVAVAENDTKECHPVAERLGDVCLYDIQCHERFSTESECWKGRCNCKLGSHHVPRSNVCYKSVRIGDFCRLTNNCIGEGTLCQRGVCTCPHKTHANEEFTECIPDRLLDETCSSDTECVVEASRCDDGVCRCASDYVISENRGSCLRVADRLYGPCDENGQCQRVHHSFCDTQSDAEQGGFCQCRNGFHNVNHTCYVTVDLGGICERNENCEKLAGAVCKGRCVCDDDYPEVDGYCLSALLKGQNDGERVNYSKIIVLSNLLFLLCIYSTSSSFTLIAA